MTRRVTFTSPSADAMIDAMMILWIWIFAPLEHNRVFLEETILVSRPGGDSRELQARSE